jgi:hypothetical protein
LGDKTLLYYIASEFHALDMVNTVRRSKVNPTATTGHKPMK